MSVHPLFLESVNFCTSRAFGFSFSKNLSERLAIRVRCSEDEFVVGRVNSR